MKIPFYLLKDKEVIPAKDVTEWGIFFETADRVVENTVLPDGVRVSTVFVGVGTSPGDDPLLFETMVFGGEHDMYMRRYRTWDEALEGHYETLDMIFEV